MRLRSGHSRLSAHMNRKFQLAPSPTCSCGQEGQTTDHILQPCPVLQAVWPRGPDHGPHPTALPCSASRATGCVAKRTRQRITSYSVALFYMCDRMCGQEDHQTMEHILQPCSNLQAVRRDVWPRGPPDNGPHPTALPSPVISATGRVAGCYVRH